MLATLSVSTPDDFDSNNDNGMLTLREAIRYVNGTYTPTAQSGDLLQIDDANGTEPRGVNDRIRFDDALFDADGRLTIDLTAPANNDSALWIQSSVASLEIDGGVDGAGEARNVTINAGGFGRVLQIDVGQHHAPVILRNLTLTGGHAQSGGSPLAGNGGGVLSVRSLTMENVSAIDNIADDHGGGIYVSYADEHELVIDGGRFALNFATRGGGMYLEKDAIGIPGVPTPDLLLSVNRAIITENTADIEGGGIYMTTGANSGNDGVMAIRNSTVSNNTVTGEGGVYGLGNGGGIWAAAIDACLLIDGVSIFGNSTPRNYQGPEDNIESSRGGHGGGIFIAANNLGDTQALNVEIVNSTIARNQSISGGGIFFSELSWYFSTIRHSTIVENDAGPATDTLPTESFGGGIAIDLLDTDTTKSYGSQVFLDHTIVTGNDHVPNPDKPRGPDLQDLGPDEVHHYQFSPNIGYAGLGEAQGYIDEFPNSPNDNTLIPPPGAPLETMIVEYSHIGSRGIAPFPEIITLDESNPIGTGSLVELPDLDREALGFLPVGGFVDAGDDTYTPTNLPTYELNNVATALGLSGNEIDFDQRDDPFVRISHPTQGPITGARIDIGAIEVQPDPDPDPDPTKSPTINNVLLSGSGWTGLAPISMSQRIAFGEQYRALAQEAVNTISIRFSEPVEVNNSTVAIGPELTLAQTTRDSQGVAVNTTLDSSDFTFLDLDPVTNTATWQFHSSLPDGKFAIHLTTNVTDADGNPLDGDWSNPHSGTPDDYQDDPADPRFQSGDGIAGSANNEFRFHFAILAGDFDGDGEIDGADQLQWQRLSGTNSSFGDADGDGDVDSDDLDVWQGQFNEDSILPLRTNIGDIANDNEIVDIADWTLFKSLFNTTDPRGDFNGDGIVNSTDLFIFDDNFLTFSAWYVDPMGEIALAVTSDLPPQILNVIITGSASLHDPYSFDAVDGDGSQLVTVPVGGADMISIVFSEAVNVSPEHLYVVGLTTANLPTLAEFTYEVTSHTAVWRFESWAVGDNYLLSLSDAVTDVDGNYLDGEWVNPISTSSTHASISTFPSGDGVSGGRFNFIATLLPGDADLDGDVDQDDEDIFTAHLMVGGVNKLFIEGDFNGDGATTFADIIYLSDHSGADLTTLTLGSDFDSDFDVDDDDIDLIGDNMGMTGATWADGDFDGDGQVTEEDLDLAFALYGLELDAA